MIIKSPGWSFYVHPLHRTLSEVAAKPRVKLRIHAKRWPVGTHCNIKWKMNRQKYAGREKLSIKISDTERIVGDIRKKALMCRTGNVCEAFVMTCRSCRHQAHCLRRRRVWALAAMARARHERSTLVSCLDPPSVTCHSRFRVRYV